MNYNKLQLGGRLTRDVELKYTPNGTAIGNFGVAVNRQWKSESGDKKEEVTFVDVTAFGKTAETIGQYLKKGNPIFLDGRLKTDSWEKDGKKFSKLVVICESFQFIGGKGESDSGSAGQRSAPASAEPKTGLPAPAAKADDDDDQIPF